MPRTKEDWMANGRRLFKIGVRLRRRTRTPWERYAKRTTLRRYEDLVGRSTTKALVRTLLLLPYIFSLILIGEREKALRIALPMIENLEDLHAAGEIIEEIRAKRGGGRAG